MKHPDLKGFDAEEQQEWLDALDGVLKRDGVAAASALLQSLAGQLIMTGASQPFLCLRPIVIPSRLPMRRPCPGIFSWSDAFAV